MKKLLTLFAALAICGAANAQLAPNSIAPNFDAVDINGNPVNLYEIVESGKAVIIDVSATWCGPCWNYHNTHTLETLYEQYGPNGTDELMVLFVEGDPSTDMDCLMGNSVACPTTQGNWINGTPYPIIDNAEIAEAYKIAYFPTIYLVCTNHLVSEVGQLSVAAMKAKIDACPEATPGTALTALTLDSDYAYGKICGTQAMTPNLMIVNSGTDTLKSLVIELRVNNQLVQTLNYTDPIPSLFPRLIEFDEIQATGATIVKATVKTMNGIEPTTQIFKQKSFAKAKSTATKSLTLEFKTDGYGQETYWEVIDDQGTVYGFGGNELVGPNGANTGTPAVGPGSYGNNTVFTETIEVPADGCYFLHMVDSYGDGMCYQATGYYKLFETATPTNILANGGCNFANENTIFGADGIVGVNDIVEVGTMRVFPNPATDVVRVDFSMKSAAEVQMVISNSLGQTVRDLGTTNYSAGANNQTINVSDLSAGIYMISLRTAEGTITRTFSVN